jgi:hypothetical protein
MTAKPSDDRIRDPMERGTAQQHLWSFSHNALCLQTQTRSRQVSDVRRVVEKEISPGETTEEKEEKRKRETQSEALQED